MASSTMLVVFSVVNGVSVAYSIRPSNNSTQQYMIEDGFIFFLMRDGTVSDGDHKYSSLAELEREHDVILAYRATRQ